ncbi:hypothetical protein [Paenibacillus sinopodophylli]|uniref:hypothetical protein n=1 Tax=Paenibacillus sinopodophylli TaxID=1837342 RepID=UPI00110CFFE9|nr:hypothetical protein [Paenibacillus sinopodophylli]
MVDGSLRAKQEKLQLDSAKVLEAEHSLQQEEKALTEQRSDEGANPEWQRFYEVIKGITKDMRYD